MKAITIWQPWASLIAVGAKRVETRHWTTRHRGWLAIHAAKRNTPDLRELTNEYPFADALATERATRGTLPLAAIVAVARLVDCVPAPILLDAFANTDDFPEHERAFGGYLGDDRVGWVLEDVVALPDPVECVGAQGLWNLPPHVLDAVRTQYRIARQAVAT